LVWFGFPFQVTPWFFFFLFFQTGKSQYNLRASLSVKKGTIQHHRDFSSLFLFSHPMFTQVRSFFFFSSEVVLHPQFANII